MLNNPIYYKKLEQNFCKDVIEISFSFKIDYLPENVKKDEEFIFDDEILLLNTGEIDKFSCDYIYQSKFIVFKDNDSLNFGGYAPDWNRKTDIIKNKDNSEKFKVDETYNVKLIITKYRVYIEINNEIFDSYANARNQVNELAIYLKNNVKATIYNVSFIEKDLDNYPIDKTLKEMIDQKIVINYLNYHVEKDGVYFERLNLIQNIKCTTRNSGQYDSNIMLDMYTNSKTITIDYMIMDSEVKNYEFQFGFLVNRHKVDVPLKKVNKSEHYIETFKIINTNSKANRITIIFPTGFNIAIKSIKLDDNAIFKKVKKDCEVIFLGDSITEGSECFDPSCTYFSKVTLHYNFIGYNFAVSGRTFNDYNLLGKYNINPKYVFLANGTNSFAMGNGNKHEVFKELEKNMIIVINAIHTYFPKAQIIALLPIYRSDEKGVNFSLKETSDKIKEIYQRYQDITIVDAYNYIPHDAIYFSNATLALHPNSKGHEIYGNMLINDLERIIGKAPIINDKNKAIEEIIYE